VLAPALDETWPGSSALELPLQAAAAGRAAAARSWFLSRSPAPRERWWVGDGLGATEPMALGVRRGEGGHRRVEGLVWVTRAVHQHRGISKGFSKHFQRVCPAESRGAIGTEVQPLPGAAKESLPGSRSCQATMAQPWLRSSGSNASADTGVLREGWEQAEKHWLPVPGMFSQNTARHPSSCPAQRRGGRGLGDPKQRDGRCWGGTRCPVSMWAIPSSSCFPHAHFSSPACFAETCQCSGEVPEGSPLAGQHPGKAPHAPATLTPFPPGR